MQAFCSKNTKNIAQSDLYNKTLCIETNSSINKIVPQNILESGDKEEGIVPINVTVLSHTHTHTHTYTQKVSNFF